MNDSGPQSGSVMRGVLAVLGAHAVVGLAAALLWRQQFTPVTLFVMVFGLSQWLYVFPIAVRLELRGEPRSVRGVWIAGAVSTFVYCGCAGYVVSNLHDQPA